MNVLIIDDEQLILENVCRQVNGFNLAIDQVFCANSANQAREILSRTEIDVILCDIVMPEEDGISFAGWCQDRYPDCIFVFLTSHSDFEYMKKAISLKSFDYLLQPATEEELSDVLSRAIIQRKLQKENKRLMEDEHFLKSHDEDILETMSFRYITGLEDNREYLDQYVRKIFGEVAKEAMFFPFYMKVLSQRTTWSRNDHSLIQSIYKNIIDEISAPLSMRSIVFPNLNVEGDAWVLLESSEYQYNEIEQVMKLLENVRVLYDKLLGTSLAVYTSGFCEYTELKETVEDIREEMSQLVSDVPGVHLTNSEKNHSRRDYLSLQINTWQTLINQNKIRDLSESLQSYLDNYAEKGPVSREFLIRLHQDITGLILKKLIEQSVKVEEVFTGDPSYYDFMYCTDDLDTFRSVISKTLEKLSMRLEEKTRDPIKETIEYIHSNIDRDISVNELAEKVGLSTEYFSRQFRNTTGMNLKKFIVNEKMDVARTLLATTNLTVTAIAGHVGYNNYSNFTYSFRLLYGETPSDFRNRQKKLKE